MDPNLAKGFVETELWQYVRRITSPTIYIIGGRSTIVPVETPERLKKTIPAVEIVTMPGLGRYLSQEKPDAFTQIAKVSFARGIDFARRWRRDCSPSTLNSSRVASGAVGRLLAVLCSAA